MASPVDELPPKYNASVESFREAEFPMLKGEDSNGMLNPEVDRFAF